MGTGESKISVLDINCQQLQNRLFIEPSLYGQPFRKFSSEYHKKSMGSQHEFITRIKVPEQDQTVSLTQFLLHQIQQAYEQKTKNFQILSIIFDDYYTNRFTYVVQDLELTKTILTRQFQTYDSHTFGNIACEVSISELISKLPNKNLLKLKDFYLIENDQIKFENPKTQVLEFEGVAASLAQIIKYRRQNNWEWTEHEFNQLVYDLSSGLTALHDSSICHNDIRPDNVFYSPSKNCYVIGNFSYATTNASKGNLRNNRASKNYVSSEASCNELYDLKKSDVFSLGSTLLCAIYLCNPVDIHQSQKYNSRFKGIVGYKAVQEMIRPQQQRRPISDIFKALNNPNFKNNAIDDLLESLRYKIKPKTQYQRIYKQACSEFFKRLGLWQDWRVEVELILQSNYNLTNFQTAQLYEQLALINYCQDDLDQSTMYAKKAAKIFRQMGEQAFRQGDHNLAQKNYKHALECSKFYINPNDMDLAKSLICLSKVHAQKREQQMSSTLLKQAKDLVAKQSSEDSILYSQMKIKQAELSKKFFHYQEALNHLEQALNIAKKMQGINLTSSKLCQAKILTLIAECQILISKKKKVDQKIDQRILKAQQYLNESKNIYLSLEELDCHLELAQNTQILGQLNVQKKDFPQGKLCFEKSLQMRRQYQEKKNQAPYIIQHGITLLNLGKCQRIMNRQNDPQIFKEALHHQEQALQIFRKVYGSDHNFHSAVVLKEMGELFQLMDRNQKSNDCFRCSKQILDQLFGERSPYDEIGEPHRIFRS